MWAKSSTQAAGGHILRLNFSLEPDLTIFAGLLDAKRIIAEDTENFKIAMCYVAAPNDHYETPGDSDDKFLFDNSVAGTQIFVHEFNHFVVTPISECGVLTYDLINGPPSYVSFISSVNPAVPHKMTVTIDSATAV